MKLSVVLFIWFSISICVSLICSRSAAAFKHDVVFPLLGLAPQDEEYYRGGWSSSGTLKCKDGSNQFATFQLNDDFCDCPDATDEPGTSACPNGKFYCKNTGHIALSIYSSRVNDGICDCCDGSDEYDGKMKCPNTCWNAGKEARENLMKKIAIYEKGVTIRKQEVEEAKLTFAKEEAELSKLQNDEKILKGLVEQLKEQKEQIEKAEEKERLEKVKEETERFEAAKAKKEEETKSQTNIPQVESTENEAKAENTDEITKEVKVEQVKEEEEDEDHLKNDKTDLKAVTEGKDESGNSESLSREELGRNIASRWTKEKTKEVDGPTSNDEKSAKDLDEENTNYDSDDEDNRFDDDRRYDDDEDDAEDQTDDIHPDSSYKADSDEETDLSDIISPSYPSWLEKLQNSVRSILQSVKFFQEPVDKSEAAHIKKEYDESSDKLTKMQSRISSLTKKLKQDFGPDKEFFSFYGQCFEGKENKYVYKICAFKEASQTEGHSKTRLGKWDKFEDSYRTMQFSNGDKCWNGPDRSLKVKLRCGLTNEVSDVDEPSRCEYLAFLSTPALCREEKLKELQDKLDKMNKELPKDHDEL